MPSSFRVETLVVLKGPEASALQKVLPAFQVPGAVSPFALINDTEAAVEVAVGEHAYRTSTLVHEPEPQIQVEAAPRGGR